MKTLQEILDEVNAGGRPSYEELRYALLVMGHLADFDLGAARVQAKLALSQLEEAAKRRTGAGGVAPKAWLGWPNDPDNQDFQDKLDLIKGSAGNTLH